MAPLTKNRLDLTSLLLGATLVDIDVVVLMFTRARGAIDHGFLHTFYGSLVVALLVAILALPEFRQRLRKLPFGSRLVDRRERPISMYYISGLIGAWTHILLDAILYEDLNPYHSSPMNPFYVEGVGRTLYAVSGFALFALMVWLFIEWRQPAAPPKKQSVLEKYTWNKIGALLVVFAVLFTINLEINAPSPVGMLMITSLEIEQHSGGSLILVGTTNRVKGVMADELMLEAEWDGNNKEISLSNTASTHFFREPISPVRGGDTIVVHLYLARDMDRPRAERSPIHAYSIRVPNA